MIEEFKNITLLGLGSAAYSYEKATKSISDKYAKNSLILLTSVQVLEHLKENS